MEAFQNSRKRVSVPVLEVIQEIALAKICAGSQFTTAKGEVVEGEVLSWIQQEVTYRVKGLGRDLEDVLEHIGFKWVYARNCKGQECRVWTV